MLCKLPYSLGRGFPVFRLVRGGWILRALLLIALTPGLAPSQEFIRGDANGDGNIAILDAINSLQFLFVQGATPPCLDALDIDDDGSLAIIDPILLLHFLFLSGPAPADPFPACGMDPTADSLDCAIPPTICNVQVLSILLGQGLSSVELEVGASQFVAFVPTLVGTGGVTRNVTFAQTIDPANGGITLNSDYPFGGWSTSVDTAFLVNESILANIAGTYTITNTAMIVGTGETATTTLEVLVTDVGVETIMLEKPGFEPGALPVNSVTPVTFTCLTSGVTIPPASVSLERVDAGGVFQETLGVLVDDGVAPDLTAGDQVYSGTFGITTGSEGFFYYRVTSGVEMSPISDLLATTLPIGVPADSPGQFIPDGAGGMLVANQILCKAVDPSDSAGIVAAVATIGGTIEGTVPALCLVVVGIVSDGTMQNVIDQAATLQAHPAIEFAEPNFVAEADAFTPNDPSFAVQSNMTVVRADEAWVGAHLV